MPAGRSRIYAPRIKGDLDLGLENSRIDADLNRQLARIITPGGRLPGGVDQDILEVSATPNYRIGTRLRVDDRTYYYGQADAARQLRAAYPVYGNLLMTETGAIAATALVGAKQITCTAVAAVALNQFAGGRMVVSTGAGYGTQYHILSNTAADPAADFTVTLQEAIVVQLGVGVDVVTLYRSPWAVMHSMRQELIDAAAPNYHRVSWVGVPNRFVPSSNFCWVQTWGPCFVVESHDMGAVNDIRMTYFSDDGSLGEMVDNEVGGVITYSFQIAGPILPVTTAGDVVPSGLALINLMIAP